MDPSHDLLSTKDCDAILENCFEHDNLKVASYTVESLSDKIEGFLGDHFFVTIEYEDKDGISKSLRCFMKVLNGSSQLIFEITKSLNAYNKEKFFYTFLLNEFDKFKVDASFAPKYYFCKPYLLVLEDLSQRDYTTCSNRSLFLDLDHCKIGLKALASLHAAGFIYESLKSSERDTPFRLTEEHPEMFQEVMFANDGNLINLWFKKSIEAIFSLIPIVSDTININKDDFSECLAKALQNNRNLVSYLSKFKGTILHGDLWYNNFMFKYKENRVVDGILFDYQFLKYGPPSVDVLHFMYTNTRKIFRDKHFDELIEFYYKELTDNLLKHNLHLPKDQYLELCSELQFVVKLQCICDRSVTLLVDDSKEILPNDEELKIKMFERRSERILKCFNDNAFYKEIMSEDMIELYKILVKS